MDNLLRRGEAVRRPLASRPELGMFATLAILSQLVLAGSANAQSTGGPPITTAPPANNPPPQVHFDPPVIQVRPDPPKIPVIPVIPVTPPRTPIIPIIPTDLTAPFESPQAPKVYENPAALNGLQVLDERSIPNENAELNAEGLIVKYKPGSVYEMTSNTAVKLGNGDFLVSVRRPTKLAIVTSKFAKAYFSPDADLEIRTSDDCVRYVNLSGLKQKVIIKVNEDVLPQAKTRVFSVMPGYELVLGDHRLHRAELRPHDGYARRCYKTLENGQMAISEISVESVLKNSDLVAELGQTKTDVKEKRILADMSKMAAVLNYVNGTAAFEALPKASLELKYQIKQQGSETQN